MVWAAGFGRVWAIANREMIDGLEVVVQTPDYQKEELAYLKMTSQESYESMEQLRLER
ncbi:hypothetical protein [Myxosarcina sp. GI1(2024)]